MTRFFDIVLSLLALVVLSPLVVVVVIGLLLTGEHHVLYAQKRVGRGGKNFPVLKFATMLKDSPSLPGGVLTQKNDPRILPMGNFLRKTKINELPQLINILVGQMSFVGPRPQARRHYELYSPEVRSKLDVVRPGLTGMGSVVFRDEEAMLDKAPGGRDHFHDTVIAPYKGELELWYTAHRGLGSYFKLILLTALAVVRPSSDAYKKVFRDLPSAPASLGSLL